MVVLEFFALLFPTTGEQLVTQARPKNRALAVAVATFVVAVFGLRSSAAFSITSTTNVVRSLAVRWWRNIRHYIQ
jgi:hypothetical protein